MRELRGEGGLASGNLAFTRRRFANLYRRLLPSRGRLFLRQLFALRWNVPLRRDFVMSCRDVRVLFIMLQSGRVRGASTFVATSYCRLQVNEQSRSRERRTSVIQRAHVLLLISLRLFLLTPLRAAMSFLEDPVNDLVGPLGGGRINVVTSVLKVGKVANAFARERGVRHVRRIHFPRTILSRGTIWLKQR